MSDIVFDSAADYDFSANKRASKKSGNRSIKILFLVLFLLLIVEAAVYLLVIPCMGSVKVSWSGISDSEKMSLSNIISDEISGSWLKFDTSEAQSLISSVPGVDSVRIVKRFPDRVFINVTERVPVAMTFMNADGRTVPVQIDKKGVLFTSDSVSSGQNSVPIISGIPVENIPEGMRIPSKYHVLIDQIASIRAVNENYFAEVSEIRVVPKEYGNYELVLYPVKGHTRVLADRTLNEEALQYMMVTLDVVKRMDPDVKIVDLRYGSVSYYSNISDIGESLE